MTGDPLLILEIDLPLAFVLACPWLLLASILKRRNAPLVVPAVMLFVLGLSSLYVALVESPSAAYAFQTLRMGSDLLRHQHDLTLLAISTLAAATLLFVIGLLFWDVLKSAPRQRRLTAAFVVFAAVYGACTIWLLTAAHEGAILAKHVVQHSHP